MNSPVADLEPVERGAEDADALLILLHGLGADGNDLAALVPHLELPPARWRFVFPQAPVRPVTINGGMAMRAWYDIDPDAGFDSGAADIAASAAAVSALLEREQQRGVPAHRIVLGGFSQGGVIALRAGLGHSARLAGLVGLSTYLPNHADAADHLGLPNLELPVFLAHGSMDPMIPVARAATARSVLEELGFPVTWHEYPMGHEVCLEEISDLSRWLAGRFEQTVVG